MKSEQLLSFLLAIFMLLATFSPQQVFAQKGKEKTQAEIDNDLIKNYLKKNKLTKKFTKTETGLYYHIEQKGEGKPADADKNSKFITKAHCWMEQFSTRRMTGDEPSNLHFPWLSKDGVKALCFLMKALKALYLFHLN
ncbi:MAG: hypothetical protein IPM47_16480 [Sphingobacteriales bacterium]|nr:MAG: hypothetical protein IPM47_16480 [Sphingobacteriales bacterium]